MIGISINTMGVVFVALRGIGWLGFGLMLLGMALLLYAVVTLAAEARRRDPSGEEPASRGDS